MSTAEPCTTEGASNNKRHYSTNLERDARQPGHVGTAACSTGRNRIVVRDQEWFTATGEEWNLAWRLRMDIEQLPECGNCARILHH